MGKARKVLSDQIEFFEKFGNMLNSAVPLRDALEILAEELESPEISQEIHKILKALKDLPKEENLFAYFKSDFFNQSTLAMLAAGERTGQLDYVCIKIANCLRAELNNSN